MNDFSLEEKIAAFDKIANLYFDKNFGSTSKADLETLLFSEYIEHRLNNGLDFDDYTLAKELGITQSRIRSLKEKKELKYPYEAFTWMDTFAKSVKNAKYDENEHYVKIIIQDINVMNEVRHYIEEKGWYDEVSLNKKLLKIPLDCFVEICIKDEMIKEVFSDETRDSIKIIAKNNSEIKGFLSDFTEDGFKKFLMSASKIAIGTVLDVLPFGGAAKVAFGFLGNIIKGM